MRAKNGSVPYLANSTLRSKLFPPNRRADFALAKLIDEAMEEEGEVPKEKIEGFIKKYGRKV